MIMVRDAAATPIEGNLLIAPKKNYSVMKDGDCVEPDVNGLKVRHSAVWTEAFVEVQVLQKTTKKISTLKDLFDSNFYFELWNEVLDRIVPS